MKNLKPIHPWGLDTNFLISTHDTDKLCNSKFLQIQQIPYRTRFLGVRYFLQKGKNVKGHQGNLPTIAQTGYSRCLIHVDSNFFESVGELPLLVALEDSVHHEFRDRTVEGEGVGTGPSSQRVCVVIESSDSTAPNTAARS